jgi:hypothetical protein
VRSTEVRAYAHVMIHTAALWDVAGAVGLLPPWWPPVSWVCAAAGMAAGCAAVLIDVLGARRGLRAADAGGRLLALGILLGAWLLRGDAEIAPELPIVAAEVLAPAHYALHPLRRKACR